MLDRSFFEALDLSEKSTGVSLSVNNVTSMDRAGRVLTTQTTPPLWRASFFTMPRADAHSILAQFRNAIARDPVFEAYDTRNSGPASDPDANPAGVTVGAINVDRLSISIAGLPVGFVLTAGDYIEVVQPITGGGDNLHLIQLLEGGVADASGDVFDVHVVNGVSELISAGQVVNLHHPCARFRLLPDDFEVVHKVGLMQFSFSGLQVIK